MKKTIVLMLAAVFMFLASGYALETGLMDIRGKLFTESQEIKALLPDTKDVILVNSMWDSCVLTISQLDAYFSQLGIFNTIKQEDITATAIDFLERWLQGIKNTNNLNIKSLQSMPQDIQARSKLHLERLVGYFTDLNAQIDVELEKLATLKKVVQLVP